MRTRQTHVLERTQLHIIEPCRYCKSVVTDNSKRGKCCLQLQNVSLMQNWLLQKTKVLSLTSLVRQREIYLLESTGRLMEMWEKSNLLSATSVLLVVLDLIADLQDIR